MLFSHTSIKGRRFCVAQLTNYTQIIYDPLLMPQVHHGSSEAIYEGTFTTSFGLRISIVLLIFAAISCQSKITVKRASNCSSESNSEKCQGAKESATPSSDGVVSFTSLSWANDATDGYINATEHALTNDLVGSLVASGQSSVDYKLVASATTCDGSLTYGSIPKSNSSDFGADGTYKVCVKLSDTEGNVVFGATASTITLGPRLAFSGYSAETASVADRIFDETSTPAWTLTGNCDVAFGDVTVSGEGIDTPTAVSCAATGGGSFSVDINYDSGGSSPYFAAADVGQEITIKQSGVAAKTTMLFKCPTTATVTLVTTKAQLQAMTLGDASVIYILLNDLDFGLSTNNWTPVGRHAASNLNDTFWGKLEGNNKTISNLNINLPTEDIVGFFGVGLNNTISVSHLSFSNVNITGRDHVGALFGKNYSNNSLTSHVKVSGSINGRDYVGGLVGWADSVPGLYPVFSHCSSEGTVAGRNGIGGLVGSGTLTIIKYSTSSASVTGTGSNIGGLIGAAGGAFGAGLIMNSYASGAVSGSGYVGGLVGLSFRMMGGTLTVTNTYATGAVSATSSGGPLVGGQSGAAPTITSSYYDSGSTCTNCSTFLGTGKTAAQLKQQATFSGWDFTTPVWSIVENTSNPTFFFQQ
jgi:hypothetical protein